MVYIHLKDIKQLVKEMDDELKRLTKKNCPHGKNKSKCAQCKQDFLKESFKKGLTKTNEPKS